MNEPMNVSMNDSRSQAPARCLVPFSLSAGFFAAILAALVRSGLRRNEGTFVYPLDDAYIHLAVSRNIALHGVWGITPYQFSGASSSPAWTLLLALVSKLVGVHLVTPLILNALAGVGLLLVASWLLAYALPASSSTFRTAWLLVLVLVMPLAGAAMVGMEHVLHSLAMLALVSLAALTVHRSQSLPLRRATLAGLAILAALCGGLRYESCFAICAIAVVLLLRRRRLAAIVVLLSAATGPLLYAIFSHRHSGVALPFSVVMKSAGRGASHNSISSILTSVLLPVAVPLAAVLALRIGFARSRRQTCDGFWSIPVSFAIITLGTAVLHLVLGPEGWLMRYEAYVFALGILALALLIGELATLWDRDAQRSWIVLALLLASFPQIVLLGRRAQHGYQDVAASLHDRYVEHLGQALFAAQNYPHATIVANDIGFLAFYAPDARILDPLGLGSLEPVQLARKHQSPDPQFMRQWAARNQATLAILHTDFAGMATLTPAGWIPVESWCFPHNLVFQNHVETFFAPDPAAASALREHLSGFTNLSPEIVRYRIPQDASVPPVPQRGELSVCPAPAAQSDSSR
jgi:hypothetical protein